MGLVDLTPAGIPMAAQEAQRDVNAGNYVGGILGATAVLPAAKVAAIPAKIAANEVAQGIRAYHVSPNDFDVFRPSEFRGSSFFASTPERAKAGAGAGANEMIMETATELPQKNLKTYEVDIDPTKISGLHYTPSEKKWFESLPKTIIGDDPLEAAMKNRPNPYISWDDLYNVRKIGDKLYAYDKVSKTPNITYEEAIRKNRDVYGQQFAHYSPGADEAKAAKITSEKGMGGYLVNDEAGLSIAVNDPTIINILRKYGLFPGIAVGGAAGGGLLSDNSGGQL
jgi:hypothetical protein